MTHICVSKLTNIGSDNGLSPRRRQAIIWTNAGILLVGTLGTNISEFLIVIHTFSFNKIHLKMSSAKWHPFCLGLNVLRVNSVVLGYGTGQIYPCPSGLLDWHLGNLTFTPVPVKQSWRIWVTTAHELKYKQNNAAVISKHGICQWPVSPTVECGI